MCEISHRREWPGLRPLGHWLALIIISTRLGHPLSAQHAPASGGSMIHVMAQVIPVVTRATPTADRRSLTEAYLSQPIVMVAGERGPLHLIGTVDFEGLTLSRGELTTGAHGEGYVDRRHPHTYLHELMAGVEGGFHSTAASFYGGRGFVPFGSDDPMTRPFEKYPVNHHLAQVLERIVAIAAIRRGSLAVEAAVFNGDEPTAPASSPQYSRFADSWATRLTWNPLLPLEVSASAARVTSPEVAAGGGLDQDKRSAVVRWKRSGPDRDNYMLGEWARTTTRTPFGTRVAAYRSWLVESSVCRRGPRLSARLERTDRPEEDRTADPFRTPNPPNDNSSLGVTRWTTVTAALSTHARYRVVRARPFIEVARAEAERLRAGSLFDPRSFYGTSSMWMVSLGAKLTVGQGHDRMGRYGGVPMAPVQASKPMAATMMDMPGMMMHETATTVSSCGE